MTQYFLPSDFFFSQPIYLLFLDQLQPLNVFHIVQDYHKKVHWSYLLFLIHPVAKDILKKKSSSFDPTLYL